MRIPALILLLLALPAARAADVNAANIIAANVIEYTFDIILFENLAAKNEYLSDHAARAFIEARYSAPSVPVAGDDTGRIYELDDKAFNYRENPNGALDNTYDRLQRSGQYRVLARKNWTQSGLQDGDSVRIPFTTVQDSATGGMLPLLGDAQAAGATAYLDGSVSLSFSRYIHISTDLVLDHSRDEILSAAPVQAASSTSHVHLERKLRSNETHYIDHPLLGVLINIERVKVTGKES